MQNEEPKGMNVFEKTLGDFRDLGITNSFWTFFRSFLAVFLLVMAIKSTSTVETLWYCVMATCFLVIIVLDCGKFMLRVILQEIVKFGVVLYVCTGWANKIRTNESSR